MSDNQLEKIRETASLSTDEERQLLRFFRTTTESAATVIPDDMDGGSLLKYLDAAGKGLSTAIDLISRLKPFVGRVLLVIKRNPEIFKALGYETYDQWMTEGVRKRCGLPRSEAYACVAVAEHIDFLPATEMQRLGIGKLTQVAQALKRDLPAGTPDYIAAQKRDFWVQQAQQHTVRELKVIIEEHKLVEAGELTPEAVLSIPVNPEVKKRWNDFVEDPAVRDHCGASDAGTIFAHLLDEVAIEWLAQNQDAIRSAAMGEVQAG